MGNIGDIQNVRTERGKNGCRRCDGKEQSVKKELKKKVEKRRLEKTELKKKRSVIQGGNVRGKKCLKEKWV